MPVLVDISWVETRRALRIRQGAAIQRRGGPALDCSRPFRPRNDEDGEVLNGLLVVATEILDRF
jgi:hypothetical protein